MIQYNTFWSVAWCHQYCMLLDGRWCYQRFRLLLPPALVLYITNLGATMEPQVRSFIYLSVYPSVLLFPSHCQSIHLDSPSSPLHLTVCHTPLSDLRKTNMDNPYNLVAACLSRTHILAVTGGQTWILNRRFHGMCLLVWSVNKSTTKISPEPLSCL